MKAAGYDDTLLDHQRRLQTENHFDAILELVGPDTLMDSLTHLNVNGITCFTGELSGMDDARWTVADFDPFGIPAGAYLTHFSSDTANASDLNDLIKLVETTILTLNRQKYLIWFIPVMRKQLLIKQIVLEKW